MGKPLARTPATHYRVTMLAHKLPQHRQGKRKVNLFRLAGPARSSPGSQYDSIFGDIANLSASPLLENLLKDKKVCLFCKLMLREQEDRQLSKYDFERASTSVEGPLTSKDQVTKEVELRLTQFVDDEKRLRLENLLRCHIGYLEQKGIRLECHQRSVLLEVLVFLMNAYLPEYREECAHSFAYLLGFHAEPLASIEEVLERHGRKFSAYAIPRRAGKSFNICLLIALLLVCLPGENVAYLCNKVALQKKMNSDIQEMINEIYPLAGPLMGRTSPPAVRANESCIVVQWQDMKPCRLEIICLHNSQVSMRQRWHTYAASTGLRLIS